MPSSGAKKGGGGRELHRQKGSDQPRQDVPLWYADYFEPKAILASVSREAFAPPFTCLEKLN